MSRLIVISLLLFNFIMGNFCNSLPIDPPSQIDRQDHIQTDRQEDYFIIDHNISPDNSYRYYWVDPKITTTQNRDYIKELKTFIKITGFQSVQTLMYQLKNIVDFSKSKLICAASLKDQEFSVIQNDSRIEVAYLFCQNKLRANSLLNTFPKIKQPFYSFEKLKEFMLKQKSTQNFSALLFLEEDHIKIMNKVRANFYCLTNSKVHQNAKKQFIKFARKFYPQENEEIGKFQNSYGLDLLGQKKYQQTLEWLRKPGFFYRAINSLPMVTLDPKQLANIRFPFNQAYSCIYEINKVRKSFNQDVFIVLSPSQIELQKLKENQNNFVMFTSFVKGWCKLKKAKQIAKKITNSILIRVMFGTEQMQKQLDYGYCIFQDCDGNQAVIFNIYNLFQIKQVDLQQEKEVIFQYGSLASVIKLLKGERSSSMTIHQNNLAKNYYYLEDIFTKIENQGHILQMSGNFKDSISVCQKDELRLTQTQSSEQQLGKSLINLGDAYALNNDFQKAQESYQKIRANGIKLIAKIHLADLYFRTNETTKLKQIISEISKNSSDYQNLNSTESFKAQNYIGMNLMNEGQYKKACIHYKKLMSELHKFYGLRYEGIPLVHQIIRNRAACETKLNNYEQALSLLNSTVEWQRACEGVKSPGLIVTENLIKSLHETKGQKEEAKECDRRMKKIYLGCSKKESIYETRRTAVPTINQSAIKIVTTGLN